MVRRAVTYARMVRLSHTVFALPFALSAVVLAGRGHVLHAADIFWIVVAMAGARSAAMGVNRLVDAPWDGANPRTADREIPAGKLSPRATTRFVLFFSGVFLLASSMLGRLCFYLSVPVLAVLFSYSYTKRFTWLSHLYLGFAISLAPVGAWIAVAKSFSGPILWLSAALMTWMAGFDILYACQDEAFDRKAGLHSLPVRIGIQRALAVAAGCHGIAFGCFVALYFVFELGEIYLAAVAVIGLLLIVEHKLVSPEDLRRVPVAFFHVNSMISVLLFIGILADTM